MSPAPGFRRSTPWRHDREPQWAGAAVAAVVLIAAVSWLLPEGWMGDLFGRDFRADPDATAPAVSNAIRLIPAPSGAPPAPADPAPRVEKPSTPTEPDPLPPGTGAFTWDPTTPHSVRASLLRPAVPDSTATQAALTRAMGYGDRRHLFAWTDTTQVAAAHRRFAWMDTYMNAVVAPALEAKGAAVRNAAIYRRAVVEGEREGH